MKNETENAGHLLSTHPDAIEAKPLGAWPITIVGSPTRGYTAVHDKTRRLRDLQAKTMEGALQEIILLGVAAVDLKDLFMLPSRGALQPPPVGFVYFIGADDGPIKIGFAVTPERRLAGLQTGNPKRLTILATAKGGMGRERQYHARFASMRLHGEWFERTPALLAEIERLTEGEG